MTSFPDPDEIIISANSVAIITIVGNSQTHLTVLLLPECDQGNDKVRLGTKKKEGSFLSLDSLERDIPVGSSQCQLKDN